MFLKRRLRRKMRARMSYDFFRGLGFGFDRGAWPSCNSARRLITSSWRTRICALLGHLASHGRKFTTHLGAQLRNLQRQPVDPTRKLFELGHASLEAFYSEFKGLRRHYRSPCS